MIHSCRAANFYPVLRTQAVKTSMPSFSSVYEKLAAEDRRGMRLDDSLRLNNPYDLVVSMPEREHAITLDDATYDAISERWKLESLHSQQQSHRSTRPARSAASHPQLDIAGILYKVRTRSQNDSNIICIHPSLQVAVPARIEHIVSVQHHTHQEVRDTFLLVRRLMECSAEDRAKDPYRAFGVGYLFYDEYDPRFLAIRPEDVHCHFAKTSMDDTFTRTVVGDDGATSTETFEFAKRCVHVLPLGRVSCNANTHYGSPN